MSNTNQRIIEEDIFEFVPSTESGSSAIIDLFGNSGGANRFSCQFVYTTTLPSAKTFDSGVAEIDTATFQAKASTGAGDYIVVYDTTGEPWAVAADLTGSDPEPTGAVWTAIPSGQKTQVDLSATTTASSVATAFATAFETLVSVPFSSTPSSATVGFTQDLRGVIDPPEVHNADDSGNGSISVVVTTAGVTSEVNVSNNSVTIPAHGFNTADEANLTSTGTLPNGLPPLCYIIKIDSNTVNFAATRDRALSGTVIDITDDGSSGAVNTITISGIYGPSLSLFKSNNGQTWRIIGEATSISSDGDFIVRESSIDYRYFRAVKTILPGQDVDLKGLILVVGD